MTLRNKKLLFLILPLCTTLSLEAKDPFDDPFGDNIFNEMMEMQKEMDQMFQRMHNNMQQRSPGKVSPMHGVKIGQQGQFVDKGEHYAFETTIPESKENQIDVSTQDGVMSITAKVVQTTETNTTHGYSSSSSMRMYQQHTPIPRDANQSTLNMGYENARLVITVKKNEGHKIQKIVPLLKEKKSEEIKLKENNTTIKKIKLDDSTSMI